MDCYEAAQRVGVSPSTIRQWARRGHIVKGGTGPDGRALYWSLSIMRHAERRRELASLRPAVLHSR